MKPDFAKLFTASDGSQIVAMLKESEDGTPEIRLWFDPGVSGLAVCETAFGYEDNKKGRQTARQVFAELNEAMARKAVDLGVMQIADAFG